MAKKISFEYCDYSETIRQKPQNYCLMVFKPYCRWVLDFDSAIENKVLFRAIEALKNHGIKWSNNPQNIVDFMNKGGF